MIELAAVIPWSRLQTAQTALTWATSAPISQLEQAVSDSKNSYYNTAQELVPDASYESLEVTLKRRKPRSAALITGAPVHSLEKTKLPVYLGSQDKLKTPDALARWLTRQAAARYLVSAKLDGMSFLLTNATGTLKLYTRGDGTMGKDISVFLPHLDLPKIPRGTSVRGEMIISAADYAAYSEEFANERAMVVGLTNRNTVHAAIPKIASFAFELMDGTEPSKQFARLRQMGFRVPPNELVTAPTWDTLAATLLRLAKGPFKIDGLVLAADIPYTQVRSGNPDHTAAFKPDRSTGVSIDTELEATVKQVVWRETRQGYITPRIQINPTRIDGITCNFANGHNAKNIYDKRIGPGAVVTLVRAGQVIPYITGVVKPARKPQMPTVEYTWSGADVVAVAPTDEVQLRQAEHFFQTLGIEGIKYGSITKLFAAGQDLETLVRHSTVDELTLVLGVNGIKIHRQIEAIYTKPYTLDVLMDASGLFEMLGETRLPQLVKAMPNLMKASQAQVGAEIDALPGWGTKLRAEFLAKLPAFKEFMRVMHLPYGVAAPVVQTGRAATGHTVLFTNFRDDDLAHQIVSNGGTVAGGYSRAVTHVLSPAGKTSAKTERAEADGKTVMDPAAYRRQHKL